MVAHTLRKSTFLVEVIELGWQDFASSRSGLLEQLVGDALERGSGRNTAMLTSSRFPRTVSIAHRRKKAGGDQDNRFKVGT
jgi:hypothetical protein